MKFLHILIISLIFLLNACISHDVEVPSDIIPRDTMVQILTDIRIFESTSQVRADRNVETFNIEDAYRYEFKKFNITREEFEKSMQFYSQHPKYLEEMYDEVITGIAEKEAEYQSKTEQSD